jgi:hypothetical protein
MHYRKENQGTWSCSIITWLIIIFFYYKKNVFYIINAKHIKII